MGNLLKVVATEVRQDKNGRNYKYVQFETPNKKAIIDELGNRVIVKTPSRLMGATFYEKSYLNDKPEFGWDLEKGESLEGDIATRNVASYEIVDSSSGEVREATSYSAIVLGDSNAKDFEIKVEKAFTSAGHDIIADKEVAAAPALTSTELPELS
jgi:hypothetical protein